MDSDDDYHNIDKYDRDTGGNKFDSDGSDKDERERQRMNQKLKNKQKKQKNKKGDVDINAFIAGGAEEEEKSSKKKKMSKKEKREAKKNKQKQKQKKEPEDDDEKDHEEKTQDPEDIEEEKVVEEEKKEPKKEKKALKWPLKVYYCPKCTAPPEYCAFVSQDLEGCKEDLQERVPKLYSKIYEGRDDEIATESKGKKKKNKNLKKHKEITKSTQVKVVKYKRGGKKMVTEVSGLDGYDLNLKDFSKKLGKKFACGNGVIKHEETGEQMVQFLGDIDEDAFMIALDKDFPHVAIAKFKFESGGNKKGRKKK